MNTKSLLESIKEFENAISYMEKARVDPFYFGGISKAFEVCLEYCWKYFKRYCENEGLEPMSPRDSIKMAGQVELISDVALWLDFLNQRNLAVHDYFASSEEDYLKLIEQFAKEIKLLQAKLRASQ